MKLPLGIFDIYLEVDPRARLFFVFFGMMLSFAVASMVIDKSVKDQTAFVLFVMAHLMLVPVGYTCWKFIKIRRKEGADKPKVKYIICENCYGDVTPSSGKYLCLSGCGHVNGRMK